MRAMRSLTLMLLLAVTALFMSPAMAAEKYNPFVLASVHTDTFNKVNEQVLKLIENSPFDLVASYQPYDGATVHIISSSAMQKQLSKEKYGGFAAPQRVSVTQVGPEVQVAFTNPVYMQYAYRLDTDLSRYLQQLTDALGYRSTFGTDDNEGLSERKLKRYKYAFGMEDFDSFYELPAFDSHKAAIKALEKGLKDGDGNGVSMVYKIKMPNINQVIYGVAFSEEDSGNEDLSVRKMMDVVDSKSPKRTPFLPYEIMVNDDQIIALHARFRIALYFSDLKMFGKTGFGQIIDVPGAYGDAFIAAAGGKKPSSTTSVFY